MESTNEATLLYMLAAEILGRRPEKVPPRARPTLQTYLSLQEQASAAAPHPCLDAWQNFSDLMVEIEAYIAPGGGARGAGTGSALGRMWAFCLPQQRQSARVLDARRRPALQAPALPGHRRSGAEDSRSGIRRSIRRLLVRAAAAGVDLASVLADINAALPNYRFSVMLPKAVELCNEVRSFGAALLSALEKKDGEELARLRSRHEVELLETVRAVKSKQVDREHGAATAAEKSKLTVEARRDHYRGHRVPESRGADRSGACRHGADQEVGGRQSSDALAAIAALVAAVPG